MLLHAASPTRLPAGGRAAWDAPWLPAPARQPNLAPYATVASPSPLKAPPSRGKDAYIKPQTQPGARNQALLKEFSDHGPLDAWPAPAKDDSHLNEVRGLSRLSLKRPSLFAPRCLTSWQMSHFVANNAGVGFETLCNQPGKLRRHFLMAGRHVAEARHTRPAEACSHVAFV